MEIKPYVEFVNAFHIQPALKTRMLAHVQHVWRASQGCRMGTVLQSLPHCVRRDILHQLLYSTIRNNALFEAAPQVLPWLLRTYPLCSPIHLALAVNRFGLRGAELSCACS